MKVWSCWLNGWELMDPIMSASFDWSVMRTANIVEKTTVQTDQGTKPLRRPNPKGSVVNQNWTLSKIRLIPMCLWPISTFSINTNMRPSHSSSLAKEPTKMRHRTAPPGPPKRIQWTSPRFSKTSLDWNWNAKTASARTLHQNSWV